MPETPYQMKSFTEEAGFSYCNRPARKWSKREMAIFRRQCEFPILLTWLSWVYDAVTDEAFPI
jgi:hypothetical protein